MNELIKIENGEVKLDSRMIAEHFGKEHKNVLADIRDEMDKLESGGEIAGLIFQPSEYIDKNRQARPCYEMTEEGALQLAARYDAVARRKLIIKIKELKNNNVLRLPKSYAEALRELADKAEENEKLQCKIEEQKPLVLFAETCIASNDSILVRELAKLASKNGIVIGEKKLYKKLREWDLILKTKNEPSQKAMDMHLFEVKKGTYTTPYGAEPFATVKVTPKGQIYIIEKLRKSA